jgi:NADH:ubiquinone oxidoreductase subunit E
VTQQLDLSRVNPILHKYGSQDGALIPVLQEVQAVYGYLPEEALKLVGKTLRVPLSRIYGVVTFYAQFYLTPRGKHTIKCCQGTACHVRGGKGVLEALERELKVTPGGTTDDLKFSLETVACVGTCFLAPVMMIDEDYFGKLTPNSAVKAVRKYSPKAKSEEA